MVSSNIDVDVPFIKDNGSMEKLLPTTTITNPLGIRFVHMISILLSALVLISFI